MLPTGIRPLLFLIVCCVLGYCDNAVNITNEISVPVPVTTANSSDTYSRGATLDSSPMTSTTNGTPLNSTKNSSQNIEFFNENSLTEFIDALSTIGSRLPGFLPQMFDFSSPSAAKFWPQTRCQSDFMHAVMAALSGELWALTLFDSWAKPRSFIQLTSLQMVGDYDRCSHTTATSQETTGSVLYRGNYCVVMVVPASMRNQRKARLDVGTCMPDTCSAEEITSLVKSGLKMFNLSAVLHILETDCRTEHREITTASVMAIVLLCIIGLLMLTGTAVDIAFVHRPNWFGLFCKSTHRLADSEKQELSPNWHPAETGEKDTDKKQANHWKSFDISASCETLRNHKGEKDSLTGKKSYKHFFQGDASKVLLCFSIYSNGKSILKTDQNPEALTALYGIRVITAWWIVFSHVLCIGFVNNNFELSKYRRALQMRTLDFAFNGTFAVDTFFVISGLLTSYLLSKEIEKKGWKIKWHQVFFHRYWRLTPPYLLVLVVIVGLGKFMGSGPMWPNSQPEYLRPCEKYWWTNLLYINNIVSPTYMCGTHFWYLAMDMQFFLLTPLMLIPFCINMYAGLGSCLFFLLINWITAGVLSTEKNWVANMALQFTDLAISNREIIKKIRQDYDFYFQYYYMFPFTRIGPYVVGILAGKFLAVTNRQFKMQWYVVTLCWITSFTTGLTIIYATHGNSDSRSMSALYNAFSRTAWGASVCWIIVSCALGYGGPVSTLLSWSPFVVMSRLTYMIYLIHVTVIDVSYSSMDQESNLTKTGLAEMYMGVNMMTGLLAFVLVLCFESPFIKLEKIFLSK